jgi:hypothetical protein
MNVRKESLFMWLALAVGVAATVSVVAGRINAAAESGEQLAMVTTVPIQLGRESYGLAMVDAKRETIWIYEINTRGPAHSRLKLLAARSWHYDKLLEEYNTAEPRPQQVKNIIEQLLKPGGRVPSFDANSNDITSVAEPNKTN